MVTQQQSPVLTLRYGDVEFTLIPSSTIGGGGLGQTIFEQVASSSDDGEYGGGHDRNGRSQHEPKSQGVLWRLTNFTGTLRVVPAAATTTAQDGAASPASAKTTTITTTAADTGAAAPSSSSGGPSPSGLPTLRNEEENQQQPRTSRSGTSAATAAVVSARKNDNKAKRGASNHSKAGRSKKKVTGSTSTPSIRSAFSNNSGNASNKRSKDDEEQVEAEAGALEQSKKKKSRSFFFAPSKRSTGGNAASEEKTATAAVGSGPEPDDEPDEENSQLTTLLGQDEEEDEDSCPFPLSQEDEQEVMMMTSSTASDGGSTAKSNEAVTNSAALEIAANVGGDPTNVARSSHAKEATTIQHIMETAQSQASCGGGGAWTTDEGEMSNRSFPTQDSVMDVNDEVRRPDHLMTAEPSMEEEVEKARLRSSTEVPSDVAKDHRDGVGATVEALSAEVPRVSLGDSPPKVGLHESCAVETMPLDAPMTPKEPSKTIIPCPRWGHTFTSIGKDKFVLYGGQTLVHLDDADAPMPVLPTTLNDVLVYDAAEQNWFQPYNCQALHRQWHTSTYVPERQLLVAFGGESCISKPSKKSSKSGATAPPKPGKVKTSDVLTVLDTDLMLWYPPVVTGDVPSGRSGHTATLVDPTSIVVFGGVKGSKWINTLYVLDVDRWNWTQPKVQGVPPKPRSYHSATALSDHRIVIFGGNDAESSFNSVHVLQQVVDDDDVSEDETAPSHDVQEESGDGKATGGVRKCWRWTNPTCRGTLPSPRTGHTATLLNDHRTICVYGGWDPNAEESSSDAIGNDDSHMFSNDASCCYLLDTTTWTWRKGGNVRFASDLPVSSAPSGKNGGPRRAGHAAATLGGENSEQVLVFGGRVPGDRFAGDFQYLSGF